MSFLDQFRRMRDSDTHTDWKTISSEDQLRAALDESFQKPVIIFKHSTSCGISAGAKYRLEQGWDFASDEVSFYYLDLLAYRSISNKIAKDLGVHHQSPQVILVKDGIATFDTSHHGVSIDALRSALA